MLLLLQNLDDRLFRFINQTLVNWVGDAIFPYLNHAAGFIPLLLIALGWIAYRNSRRAWLIAFLLILGVLLGDSLVFNPLKSLVGRPRPAARLEHVRALASGATGGYSFPSSHTANAFLVAAILSFFFRRHLCFWILAAAFVAVQRVYVGVHYPSDVMGSALLGWGMGWMFLFLSRKVYPDLQPDFLRSGTRSSPQPHRAPWLSHKHSTVLWSAIAILIITQLLRLLWIIKCGLDVPPACVQFWRFGQNPAATDHLFLGWLSRFWVGSFGQSSLSLWAIPWSLQTLWLGTLAWAAWKRGGVHSLGSMVILAAILPLTAQLTFLGSPAQIFEDADWTPALPLQALIFYTLLALPLWITALLQIRSHPLSAGIALMGLILASSFPTLPWHFVALTVTGPLLISALYFGRSWSGLAAPGSGRTRLLIFFLVAYGLVLSMGVYSPYSLRKLGVTFLPRNSPQYAQTGWREWANRIRPHLAAHHTEEVWTDSDQSRDQLQYLLGRDYQVFGPHEGTEAGRFPEQPPRFYVQEVYLAQIHPHVIFLRRRDWVPSLFRQRWVEMDSTVIFRKGDPVRQFFLYLLDPDDRLDSGAGETNN